MAPGLGRAIIGGTPTQPYGVATVHVPGHPIGWPEPAAYLSSDSAGPYRARYAAFAGGDRHPYVHMGIDIAAPAGTPIRAREAGIVVGHLWDAARGWIILLEIRPGTICEDQHLSAFVAKVGARVTRGQIIARVGSTGASTGPHDHSAVYHHPTDRDWTHWRFWFAYSPRRLEVGGASAGVAWIKPEAS